MDKNKKINIDSLPVIPVSDVVIFPNTMASLIVNRKKSLRTIDETEKFNNYIFIVTQRNSKEENPNIEDLHLVGTVCKIVSKTKMNGGIKLYVECLYSAKISKVIESSEVFISSLQSYPYNDITDTNKIQSYNEVLKKHFFQYVKNNINISPELIEDIHKVEDTNVLINIMAHMSKFNTSQKISLLKINNLSIRVKEIIKYFKIHSYHNEVEDEINKSLKIELDKHQKNYVLKEKVKVINKELGISNSIDSEIENYKNIIEKNDFPSFVVEKLEEEFSRLQSSQNSQESGNIRDYIKRIIELPWGENQKSEENKNLKLAIKTLDNDFYGLTKVKERIIEYLAVSQFSENVNSQIICLVGPPGVGKSSIAKTIAKATGREYVRISLGGVKDESEIRGHRRTYLGAMPGRIINSIRKAKTNNPVILLDEIDKMSNDIKGDPASAMLEVLDIDQNKNFRDNYIELEFDLSKCLFVCTANSTKSIAAPLLDRMEIINLSTYTTQEKVQIAKKYLLNKQLNNHNLTNKEVKLSQSVIKDIIDNYTYEAGVRNLDKCLNKICRKVVVKRLTEDNFTTVNITKTNLTDYLGQKRKLKNIDIKTDKVGRVNGLAYTSYGGTVLPIEAVSSIGNGKISFTGNIGKIMGESANVAYAFVKSHGDEYGIENITYDNYNIYIHAPEGATPKDGPSAGLALAVAIYSIITNKKVKANVAMTGEISLFGDVLAIGGVKEKILAGKNYGMKKILIPKSNEPDILELEEYITRGVEIVYVNSFIEAIKHCF